MSFEEWTMSEDKINIRAYFRANGGYCVYYHSSRDYQGKRVNPPYNYGNPSQVTFRDCTQFSRGCYSLVAWIFS